MIISLFLNEYLDFRLAKSSLVELYLVDQIQENLFEIFIKDLGDALNEEEVAQSKAKISKLNLKTSDKDYQYFHKGKNHLQIELDLQERKINLSDLNKIVSYLMLQYSSKELVFTYLSPKGEYLLNSKDFLAPFSIEEVQSKEFPLYLAELLQNQLEEVIYSG
jgi:hypothetical protein